MLRLRGKQSTASPTSCTIKINNTTTTSTKHSNSGSIKSTTTCTNNNDIRDCDCDFDFDFDHGHGNDEEEQYLYKASHASQRYTTSTSSKFKILPLPLQRLWSILSSLLSKQQQKIRQQWRERIGMGYTTNSLKKKRNPNYVMKRPRIVVISYAGSFFVFLFLLYRCSYEHQQQRRGQQQMKKIVVQQQQQHIEQNINSFSSLDVKRESVQVPIIHIVNTRFMQNQPNLTTLANARLQLFQTFCLSSMVQQTSQNFYWIIKIDPELDEQVRRMLIDLVQEHHGKNENIYVVASNRNYMIGHLHGAFRGGIESHDLIQHIRNRTVYTGNIDSLYNIAKDTMTSDDAKDNQQIVLETRLDADDGLNKYFIEYIQKDAVQNIFPMRREGENDAIVENEEYKNSYYPQISSKRKWYYWCVEKHVKWYPGKTKVGRLLGEKRLDFCITPGLTVGFNIGTLVEDVPMYSHHKLYENLRTKRNKSSSVVGGNSPKVQDKDGVLGKNTNEVLEGVQSGVVNDCGADKCIGFVRQFIGAVRSRTLTSAGMEDTNFLSKFEMDNDFNEWIWGKLRTEFNVSLDALAVMQTYLQENSKAIAKENLEGQCTEGHSCKKESREKLRRLAA